MKRASKGLMAFFAFWTVIALLCTGYSAAAGNEASKRMISIVLDDSGSMYGDRIIHSLQAIEEIGAMLKAEDVLNIYTLNQRLSEPVLTVSGSEPDRIDRIHAEMEKYSLPSGGTPYQRMETAANALLAASAGYEKWLVILSDGEYAGKSDKEVQADLDSWNNQGIHTVFLSIDPGSRIGYRDNGDMGKYYPTDTGILIETVTEITGVIFGSSAVPEDRKTAGTGTKGTEASKRMISIVLDDSGSMFGDRIVTSLYAIEEFGAMLNEEDVLDIYTLNQNSSGPVLTVAGKDPDRIGKIHIGMGEYKKPSGGTPFTHVETAAKALLAAPGEYEKWLVIFSDGEYAGVSSTLAQVYLNNLNNQGIHTVFVNIDPGDGSGYQDNGDMGRYYPTDTESLIETVTEITGVIFGSPAVPDDRTEAQTAGTGAKGTDSPKRMISIVLDDSGSMYGDRIIHSLQAIEEIGTMLKEEDVLNIYTLNQKTDKPILTLKGSDQSRTNQLRSVMKKYSTPSGGTPYQYTETAAKALSAASAEYEKWLVILSDGEYGNRSHDEVQADLDSWNNQGIHTVFLSIDPGSGSGYRDNGDMGKYYPASTESLVETVSEISGVIFGGPAVPD